MTERRYVLPDLTPVTMTGDAAARLIGSGNGDAALLYIYILKNHGEFSASEACTALRMPAERISSAVSTLAGLGLLSRDAVPSPEPPPAARLRPADEPPQYDTREIRKSLEDGGEFSSLTAEVQRSLGRVMSSSDLVKLFGIYDHLGMPPEVILTLVSHCIGECRRKYGEGRIPTMRFIESVAFSWDREGVSSIEDAEAYIREQETRRTRRSELERSVGISGRTPTRSEREYLDRWIDMGHSPDAVALAYDRTVMQTGRLAWKYMDRILSDWHAKGLHTADAAEQGDRRPEPAKAPVRPSSSAVPEASADAEAIEDMKKFLDKLKNE